MPYGLKLALLGLLAVIAFMTFSAQSSRPTDSNPSPQGIYPNGGTDPPPGG